MRMRKTKKINIKDINTCTNIKFHCNVALKMKTQKIKLRFTGWAREP